MKYLLLVRDRYICMLCDISAAQWSYLIGLVCLALYYNIKLTFGVVLYQNLMTIKILYQL